MLLSSERETQSEYIIMKLFVHMFVVGSVLFGSDVFFNDGIETGALMADSRRAVSTGVQLQAYHFSTFIERKVDFLGPTD